VVSLDFFNDIILPIALWCLCIRLTNLLPYCAVVTKSGNLNFLESSGPFQVCKGTALPLPDYLYKWIHKLLNKQSQTVDKEWSSSLGVERGANSSLPQKLILLRNGYICVGLRLILWYDVRNGRRTWNLVHGM